MLLFFIGILHTGSGGCRGSSSFLQLFFSGSHPRLLGQRFTTPVNLQLAFQFFLYKDCFVLLVFFNWSCSKLPALFSRFTNQLRKYKGVVQHHLLANRLYCSGKSLQHWGLDRQVSCSSTWQCVIKGSAGMWLTLDFIGWHKGKWIHTHSTESKSSRSFLCPFLCPLKRTCSESVTPLGFVQAEPRNQFHCIFEFHEFRQ